MSVRRNFFIFSFMLLCAGQFTVCASADDHVASTCSYLDVRTAVSAASPGDRVLVPSGTCTWTSTLELTRGIELVGTGNPVIKREGTAIYWTPSSTAQAAHDTLSITGFVFDANNSNLGGAGVIRVYNTSAKDHVTLVVKENILKNVAQSGRGLYLTGYIRGVAASNIFDRVALFFGVYGNDYASWANQTQAYGVGETFFFEDNTIKFSSSYPAGYSGWTESGQGGRVVVRYNTWDYTNAAAPGEFWDIHGLQSPPGGVGTTNCQNYSTMVAEYYGNKIINQVNAYRWMAHRGGWLLMFFNTLAGNTSPYNGITQYYCNSCQATGNFNQKADNTYSWKNLANGTEKPLTVYSPGADPYGCDSDPIIENADFFNYKSNFNGTAGIGCGDLASRPTTCTTGVAYWATSQSCVDLSGMVGANPATPISGTLYKCTATNTWTPYYTPYDYPHPLRSTGSTPSQVQQLRIVE